MCINIYLSGFIGRWGKGRRRSRRRRRGFGFIRED